eukprot:2042519-Rhodomonas_salina.2
MGGGLTDEGLRGFRHELSCLCGYNSHLDKKRRKGPRSVSANNGVASVNYTVGEVTAPYGPGERQLRPLPSPHLRCALAPVSLAKDEEDERFCDLVTAVHRPSSLFWTESSCPCPLNPPCSVASVRSPAADETQGDRNDEKEREGGRKRRREVARICATKVSVFCAVG